MAISDSSSASQCPVRSSNQPPTSQPSARCPVSNAPIDPRNNMPVEGQAPAHGQFSRLSTTRVISSIPRPPDSTYGHQTNTQENWEYPSAQQFYNALLRKGWDMPEQRIGPMIRIHNKLNEDAWKEVLRWESRFHGGDAEAAKLELASFSGIHGHLSNKARFHKLGRWFFPSYCMLPDPFDRHDWIVRRPRTGRMTRYVIDYYGIKHPRRETKLVIDARPALDSIENARIRAIALAVGGPVVKYGMCLMAIGVSVYLGKFVIV